ncbi:ABC transporter ATP-binding protein [Anaerovorax odorimutans]|uniref:ABC transporter ATP-binding protein n=1 Tax=Anaerovorax odorimutans TaxID=109327 RepID=A0ABT1RSQ6_9FIRM|nr:ABC transporter ATP-binding protein [Anaerovorax odorimutans]MCQ4638220.1 ABC transporter ATP-binding protein [Anaerovorax odorimutans]
MNYAIETENLSKKYGESFALENVSLHIPCGRIYGLLGRNGAGKTTAMRLILGLAAPTSGRIKLFGRELANSDQSSYLRIGSSIETPGFYPELTAAENLSVFARLRGKVNKKAISQVLDLVGLPQNKKKFAEYSLGMKQRLALARSMMHDPELLILDEPTNGLDPIGIAEMRQLIKTLSCECKKTVLVSSHQLSEIEQLADWIGIIHRGKLLEECSYEELKQKERSGVRICTANRDRVIRFLTEKMGLEKCVILGNNEIEVRDQTCSSLEINKRLFQAGLEVSQIWILHSSLERHFQELTGGEGIA